MAILNGIHHVGTFFLFAAAVLLLITTISAPVVTDIAILKVELTNSTNLRHSSVTFGTFGHCIRDVAPVDTDQDYCYPRSIGYDPIRIMEDIDNVQYSTASRDTADALTRVMILHPIACAIAFIACFIALGSGIFGSLIASLFAALAWIVTLVVMVTDFVSFGIVKDKVNGDGSGSVASFDTAMWTILVAMVLLFFASIIVFVSCCANRRSKTRNTKVVESGYTTGPTTTRRRFWQRRNRY